MADYVFGYGSLISTESRNESGVSTDIARVRVKNLRREWNLQVVGYKGVGIVGLGAVQASSAYTCNGVLFKCNDINDWKDREEKHGYKQDELERSNLLFLGKPLRLSPEDKIWYFSPIDPREPSEKDPLRQSYLDVCLSGCLESHPEIYPDNFAMEFIDFTYKWNHWINDRREPAFQSNIRYMDTYNIDRLLSERFDLKQMRRDA